MIRPATPVAAQDVAGHYDELDRFYRELWGEDLHHGLWITGRESAARAVDQLVERVARELECLAHVEDKRAYFREVARVLRPGGRAVVTVWLSRESPAPWERRWLLEPICTEGRLAGMGSRGEYRQLATDGGLEVLRDVDLSVEVRRTWLVGAYRAAARLGRKPTDWRFLFGSRYPHTVFLKAVFRCLLAYRVGAMGYGLFVLRKPT